VSSRVSDQNDTGRGIAPGEPGSSVHSPLASHSAGQHNRGVVATPARTAVIAGLAGAAVQIALTAPFMSRYGWDRDELYFLSAAHHVAFGYVDFPPLTAWVGWSVDRLAPHSLIALRATCLAAGAATVILVAFIARELGGRPPAQWGAAFAWALTPYILGSASIFHPTWFDALAWIAFLYVATRLLLRDEPRLWLLLGVIAGVGLEAKYTIVFLIVALALALALSRERRVLVTAWPWLGLAVALLLLLPNLFWQARHGWPSLDFFASQNAQTASGTSRPAYIAEQLLFLGATAVVAAIGVVWLWRRRPKALALVPVIVTLLFLLERGRGYYPLPADALAVAAGAVALEHWLRRGRRLLLPAVLVIAQIAAIVLVAPIVVPFYSTSHLISSGIWKTGFFKDEIGWSEMSAQVQRAWQELPTTDRAGGVILAHNYGEASALQFYGHNLGPVLSGHLSWQYWRPRRLPQRFALTVGYDQSGLQALCRSWRPLARIENRWRLDNEERAQLIAACTLKQPLDSLWKPLIASDQL
jgi:4-amino-4-deoxy-L-arabinose transferase-like glycosyltransferase